MNSAYWLTNVRMESGYNYHNNNIVSTITESYHLFIKNGKIAEIISSKEPLVSDLPQQDAKGLLILPSFTEKHFHLDKTRLGGPWQACKPAMGVLQKLAIEKEELPTLTDTTRERAQKLLDLILQSGSTHIRTHVNIDPYIGLKNLENVRQALENYSHKMSCEIVAFPQHGLLRTQVVDLMRQALREGATLVGGVDPAGVDNNVEKSLGQMMELAVEADSDIDLHLHDPDHLGIYTMKKLTKLTEEAGWQGRVAISHAFGLGGVPKELASEMADMFNELGISIISTVPLRMDVQIPPIPLLTEKGVTVDVGCDSLYDSWGPFGNGDILERISRLAEYYRWIDERSLSETLGYITGGKLPLDKSGNRVWPNVGDEADIVFVDASCSAETVARKSKRKAVMYNGAVVSGAL